MLSCERENSVLVEGGKEKNDGTNEGVPDDRCYPGRLDLADQNGAFGTMTIWN